MKPELKLMKDTIVSAQNAAYDLQEQAKEGNNAKEVMILEEVIWLFYEALSFQKCGDFKDAHTTYLLACKLYGRSLRRMTDTRPLKQIEV